MYHRILVPLDGSATAERGLREAIGLVVEQICVIATAAVSVRQCWGAGDAVATSFPRTDHAATADDQSEVNDVFELADVALPP